MNLPESVKRPPIRALPLRPLLAALPLFSLLALAAITMHSDVEMPLIYSQCHSRSRLPSLSWIPALGAPLCFVISFLQLSLASVRSWAVMATVGAYFAALLTITQVESARVANRSNWLLRRLMFLWLVMNLIGGALVWQLLIVASFLLQMGREVRSTPPPKTFTDLLEDGDHDTAVNNDGRAPDAERALAEPIRQAAAEKIKRRRLETDADALAIPIAVELGFVLPSILMLVYATPATIGLWLIFPVCVTVVRRVVRSLGVKFANFRRPNQSRHHPNDRDRRRSLDLESNRLALGLVYALPVVLSVLAHGYWLWSLTQRDDRKKTTKAAIKFVEIDVFFIAVTTLYWFFVETGWVVLLAVVASSIVFGPGAGVCLGWVLRERAIRKGFEEDAEILVEREREREGVTASGSGNAEGNAAGEDTPLLR